MNRYLTYSPVEEKLEPCLSAAYINQTMRQGLRYEGRGDFAKAISIFSQIGACPDAVVAKKRCETFIEVQRNSLGAKS